MQTRRLRLGDVVDDYCPRERRLSNHVVVAMVEDAIKQTRCATCDFEHPYKDGKLPARRKKKDATAALYEQVLEGMTDKPLLAPHIVEPQPVEAPAPIAAVPVLTSSSPAAADRPKSANLRTRAKAKTAAAAPDAGAASHEAAPHIAATDAASSQHAGGAGVSSPAATPLAASSSESGRLDTAPSNAASGAATADTDATHAAHASHAAASAHRGKLGRLTARAKAASGAAIATADAEATDTAPVAHSRGRLVVPAPAVSATPDADVEPDDDNVGNVMPPGGENEPLHRRTLIRATLPRPEGEVPVRQAPTFTIREAARAPKFRRPFGRNARPQSGQNGVMNLPSGRQGARGPQARGKKGGAQHAQPGAHRFGQGQGQGHGHGSGGGHHAKGRQGGQGNKRFK